MPIGPMGEPLPYNNTPPVGGVQNQGPPMGGNPVNPTALVERLAQLAQEAEMIMGQLESMGIDINEVLAGGGQPATPVPPMPQMPVEGVTGGLGGNIPPGLLA